MKKKLLYFTSIVLFSVTTISAQKTWDMGTNTTLWPVGSANMTSGEAVVDGLTVVSGGGTFGAISGRALTWSDGYVSTQEFKSNGASAGAATNKPTTRYFSFPVSGPSTIKVWFRVNGTGGRKCQISDGTNLLGELTDEDANKPLLLSVDYTGVAGTIYVYSSSSINYFKISSTGTPLGLESKSIVTTNIYSNGKQVFVSNVKSNTKVDIYNVTGALVKTVETGEDTSIDVKAGVYVVKASSEEGTKSVKVIVQ